MTNLPVSESALLLDRTIRNAMIYETLKRQTSNSHFLISRMRTSFWQPQRQRCRRGVALLHAP